MPREVTSDGTSCDCTAPCAAIISASATLARRGFTLSMSSSPGLEIGLGARPVGPAEGTYARGLDSDAVNHDARKQRHNVAPGQGLSPRDELAGHRRAKRMRRTMVQARLRRLTPNGLPPAH